MNSLLFWRRHAWREDDRLKLELLAQREECRAAQMRGIDKEVEERRRKRELEAELKRARLEAKELEVAGVPRS